jgi:hypothetical protein
MFEYAKIKAELEQIKCPVHAKAATVVFADGKMIFENVCCDEHRKKLEAALPDLDKLNVAELLVEMY